MSYTIKQAAEILGKGKSTIRRLANELPRNELGATTYRGQPAILITDQGFEHIKRIIASQENPENLRLDILDSATEAPKTDSEQAGSASSEFEDTISAQARLKYLEDRIRVQDQQIQSLLEALAKAQDAVQAEQALHASTADQLRQITSGNAPQDPEDRQPAAPEPEVRKPSFRDRLRFLFKGE